MVVMETWQLMHIIFIRYGLDFRSHDSDLFVFDFLIFKDRCCFLTYHDL